MNVNRQPNSNIADPSKSGRKVKQKTVLEEENSRLQNQCETLQRGNSRLRDTVESLKQDVSATETYQVFGDPQTLNLKIVAE